VAGPVGPGLDGTVVQRYATQQEILKLLARGFITKRSPVRGISHSTVRRTCIRPLGKLESGRDRA